jgi:hypothetical protein
MGPSSPRINKGHRYPPARNREREEIDMATKIEKRIAKAVTNALGERDRAEMHAMASS